MHFCVLNPKYRSVFVDEAKCEKKELARNEEFDSDSENNIIEEKHVSGKDCYTIFTLNWTLFIRHFTL